MRVRAKKQQGYRSRNHHTDCKSLYYHSKITYISLEVEVKSFNTYTIINCFLVWPPFISKLQISSMVRIYILMDGNAAEVNVGYLHLKDIHALTFRFK